MRNAIDERNDALAAAQKLEQAARQAAEQARSLEQAAKVEESKRQNARKAQLQAQRDQLRTAERDLEAAANLKTLIGPGDRHRARMWLHRFMFAEQAPDYVLTTPISDPRFTRLLGVFLTLSRMHRVPNWIPDQELEAIRDALECRAWKLTVETARALAGEL